METSYHGSDPALKADLDRLMDAYTTLRARVDNLQALLDLLMPTEQAQTVEQLLTKKVLKF